MTNLAVHSRRDKLKAGVGLILAALALSLILDLSGVIQPYRLKTLDALFRRVPLPAASPQVVVVTVDQPDLDFFKNPGGYLALAPAALRPPHRLLPVGRRQGGDLRHPVHRGLVLRLRRRPASRPGRGRSRQRGAAVLPVPGGQAAQPLGSGPAQASRPYHSRPGAPGPSRLIAPW